LINHNIIPGVEYMNTGNQYGPVSIPFEVLMNMAVTPEQRKLVENGRNYGKSSLVVLQELLQFAGKEYGNGTILGANWVNSPIGGTPASYPQNIQSMRKGFSQDAKSQGETSRKPSGSTKDMTYAEVYESVLDEHETKLIKQLENEGRPAWDAAVALVRSRSGTDVKAVSAKVIQAMWQLRGKVTDQSDAGIRDESKLIIAEMNKLRGRG
jgi:hypothetical protein